MLRPRHLAALGLGVAACAASVGLVLAQDFPAPPPPPGYIPGVGQPSPGAEPGAVPTRREPTVVLGGEAPPPDEATPPAEIGDEGGVQVEPLPSPEIKKGEPMKRPRFTSAILQAVDKTTAETLRFEAKVGEPVRYKGLVLTVHACEGAAADEGYTDSIAHIDVQAQPEAAAHQPARVVFRGWMFASSPGLHPVEHPLYDVWLIACKIPAPGAPGVTL
jgi:hypothetical protein